MELHREVQEGFDEIQNLPKNEEAPEVAETFFHEEGKDIEPDHQNVTIPQSKHEVAMKMVEEAKEIVRQADEESQQCRLLLAEDLQKYEDAKASLYAKSLEKSEALIAQIGFVSMEHENDENFIPFEAKDEIEPMAVQDVSSGIVTGILFAMAGGIVAFIGLLYFASQKLGTAFSFASIPTYDTMYQLAAWYGTPFTRQEDFNIGSTVMALVVIGVMVLIYFVRITLKGKSNYRFAAEQLEDAQRYKERKSDCKEEMDRVDTHLNECADVLNLYNVLLHEKNGTLERILYLEKGKLLSELHSTSKKEVEETKNLLDTIYLLTQTPMSEEGRLSSGSASLLRRAKDKADELIATFYR